MCVRVTSVRCGIGWEPDLELAVGEEVEGVAIEQELGVADAALRESGDSLPVYVGLGADLALQLVHHVKWSPWPEVAINGERTWYRMLPVSSCPTAVVVGWLWFLAPQSGIVSLEAGETSGASLAAKARAQEENSLSARVVFLQLWRSGRAGLQDTFAAVTRVEW